MTNDVTKFCARAAGARARWPLAAFALVSAAFLGAASPAMAQPSQQGSAALTGSGSSGTPLQGQQGTVAVSGDGSTMIVGGPEDGCTVVEYQCQNGTGAVWVFTRSEGAWTQQGAKLTPTGNIGVPHFGNSVALSADGNTMLVGGPNDNSGVGAAWEFTRSNGVWTQQAKLVGSGNMGQANEGYGVALSADGKTALVGGPFDNNNAGAVWAFGLSGGSWTQEAELTGSGEVNAQYGGLFGYAVALSANGATGIVGGYGDNTGVGAVWAFTQSGGTWTLQGSKFTPSDAIGPAGFGDQVALSADGATAIIGGEGDNSSTGAAWIYSQSAGAWSEQVKLIGSDNSGPNTNEGFSVALSANGKTAIVGGPGDNLNVGAAWVFTLPGAVWTQQAKLVGTPNAGQYTAEGDGVAISGDGNTMAVGAVGESTAGGTYMFVEPDWSTASTSTHDFNGDGYSDILWKDSSGDLAMWFMNDGQESSGATLGNVGTSWSVAGSRDFTGAGEADILWLDGSGDAAIWLMHGASVNSYVSLGNVGTQWSVVGTGDFDGVGTGDILWRNTSTGDTAIWFISNGAYSSGVDLGTVSLTWQVAGTGDFNGDGTTDILWRNTSNGELSIWFMRNGQMSSSLNVGRVSTDWTVVGTGDFNGDGVSDILWRDSEGDAAIWLMNSSGQEASGTTFSGIPATWSVAETGDFNGDGKSDILWLDQSGDLGVWLMNGLSVSSAIGLGNVGTSWKVQGQNAD